MSKQAIQVQQDGAIVQLRCTRGLNRGDVLLTVPDSLWITVQTVAKSSIGSVVGQLAPWLQVIVMTINPRSAHAPQHNVTSSMHLAWLHDWTVVAAGGTVPHQRARSRRRKLVGSLHQHNTRAAALAAVLGRRRARAAGGHAAAADAAELRVRHHFFFVSHALPVLATTITGRPGRRAPATTGSFQSTVNSAPDSACDRARMHVLLFCREYFEETYAQLSASLFSQHPGAFPPDVFTSVAFTWAAVTVRSRSRPPLVGDDFALVPIADLVRHASIICSCNMQ